MNHIKTKYKFYLLLCLFFAGLLNSTNVFAGKDKLVEKAIFALNNQIALNEYYIRTGQTEKLKYVVDIRDEILKEVTPIHEDVKLTLNDLYTDFNEKSDQKNARAYILISQYLHDLGENPMNKGEVLDLENGTVGISTGKIYAQIKTFTEEILYNSKLGSEDKKGVLLHYCQGIDGLRSYWYDNLAFDQRFGEGFVTNTVDYFKNSKEAYIYTDAEEGIDIGSILRKTGTMLIEYLKTVNTDNFYSQTVREPLEIKDLGFNQYTIRISNTSPLYASVKDAINNSSNNRYSSDINDFAGILENTEEINSIITQNKDFKACIYITSNKKRPLTGENATQLAYEKSKQYAGKGTVMGLHVFEESETSILATLTFYLSTEITNDQYKTVFQNGIEPFLRQEQSLSTSISLAFGLLAEYNYAWTFKGGQFKISETWWDYPGSGLRPFVAGMLEGAVNTVTGTFVLIRDLTQYAFDGQYREEVNAYIEFIYENRIEVATQLKEGMVQSALELSYENNKAVYQFGGLLFAGAEAMAPGLAASQSGKFVLNVLKNISIKFIGKGKWLAELIVKSTKIDIPYKLLKGEIVFYAVKVGDVLQNEIARVKEGVLIVSASIIEDFIENIPEASLFFPTYKLLTETGEEIKIPVLLMKASNGKYSVKRIANLTKLLVGKYKYLGLSDEIAEELINKGLGKYLVQENATQLVADLIGDKKLRDAFNETLIDSWKRLNDVGHEARLNPALLEKISKLTPELQIKVGDLYKNLQSPAGFKGKVDYTAIKTIDGKTISVKYDKDGFPDFTVHSPGSDFLYTSSSLTGKGTDMTAANNWIKNKFGSDRVQTLPNGKIKIDGIEHTWHHHQDGKSMFPVPSNIHNVTSGGFGHSGGASIIERGLQELFESPVFN